jgi:hypothetical protein
MNKVSSFTPPPWAITKGAYGALHVGPARLDHPGKARIEYALDNGGHDLLAQRDADARLIHAAHDMLATLKWAEQRIAELCRAVCVLSDNPKKVRAEDYADKIRAIVARVEGGAA